VDGDSVRPEQPQAPRRQSLGGRELEIGAVVGERDGALLVIHVMPIDYRRR
jgi:hypothetical protein